MINKNGWKECIEINPKILVGKPLIKGTRIGVDFIIELLAQKWTIEEILKNYSQLNKADIQDVLEYSEGKISLEKAAEITGISIWKFLDILKDRKIPLYYDLEDIKREILNIQDMKK